MKYSLSLTMRPLLTVLFSSVALPERLAAQYIDPGSASVLWQVLVAGLLGVAFSFRRVLLSFWHSIRRLFRRTGDAPRNDQ